MKGQGYIALSGPVAVVDIGSNSVRLVLFEGLARSPYPLVNEKALCAIGRNMVSSGRLDSAGVAEALETLARYRQIATTNGVTRMDVVATAAVRDAANGPEFVARVEEICQGPIRVLSGEEEAELAALGVLSGIPEAEGLIGDLGGGSLELVSVAKGKVTGAGQTFPFGPLRLMDQSGERIERAKAILDEGFRRIAGVERMKGRALYAVGGAWRNLARIHMAETKYPLRVLHHYVIPRSEAIQLSQIIATQSRKSLERIVEVSRRRIEAIPYAALVLERLLKATEIDRVVISAHGVREGLLYSKLSPDMRARDPLMECAREWAVRQGRGPENGEHVFNFLNPLFTEETAREQRARRAACVLSDIGWRHHPDYRGELCFNEILQSTLPGVDHGDRTLIALAVFYRYAGEEEFPENRRITGLLDPDRLVRALRIGLGARLAFNIFGPATSGLGECALRVMGRELVLTLPKKRAAARGETVEKRLEELAGAFGKTPRIEARG